MLSQNDNDDTFIKIDDGSGEGKKVPAGQQTMVNSVPVVMASDQNSLFVKDIIGTNGQYRAISVTSSAVLALGGAVVAPNRKFISVTPTNGDVYWGFDSSVTVSNGTPIKKGQSVVFRYGSLVTLYLVSAGTVDCRIAEGIA